MAYIVIKGDELYHHGIKGMKWGVRRYCWSYWFVRVFNEKVI